jgi:hypothetical protein
MAMERAREPSTPGRAPTCKLSAGRVHAMTSVMTERRTIEDLAMIGKMHIKDCVKVSSFTGNATFRRFGVLEFEDPTLPRPPQLLVTFRHHL